MTMLVPMLSQLLFALRKKEAPKFICTVKRESSLTMLYKAMKRFACESKTSFHRNIFIKKELRHAIQIKIFLHSNSFYHILFFNETVFSFCVVEYSNICRVREEMTLTFFRVKLGSKHSNDLQAGCRARQWAYNPYLLEKEKFSEKSTSRSTKTSIHNKCIKVHSFL